MGSPKALQPLGIDLNECPNDDISDPALSLGSESEKSGASVDHNILLESKHEDRNLNASEIHHEETAGTRQIILGHPSAAPYGTNLPTISTGEGHDMVRDYPAAAKGGGIFSWDKATDQFWIYPCLLFNPYIISFQVAQEQQVETKWRKQIRMNLSSVFHSNQVQLDQSYMR
jgi:hypothetical protein